MWNHAKIPSEKNRKTRVLKYRNRKQIINKMGYCAKVRIYSHVYCVIALLSIVSNQVKEMHAASAGSSSWPSMKTYDIWGSPENKGEPMSSQHSSKQTTSTNVLLQDYRHKTSFRNEKGMQYGWNCVNSICFFIGTLINNKKWLITTWCDFICMQKHHHDDTNELSGLIFITFELICELQCWASLQRQAKTNANQRMDYGPVFAWIFMIAIKKGARQKDSVHLVLERVAFVCKNDFLSMESVMYSNW